MTAGGARAPEPAVPAISVVLTCFNERNSILATLSDLVDALCATVPDWEIIVIDDASTDDSATVIESDLAARKEQRIRLLRRERNVGFVANVFDGARTARGTHFWVVSGDRTVPREVMEALLHKLGTADIVIPYVGQYVGRKAFRRTLSLAYARLVGLVGGSDIRYFNGGSLYRREDFVREIPNVSGFSYSAEIMLRLARAGRTYVEVPVVYREGQKARSTAVSWKHLLEVTRFFLRLLRSRIMRD